MIFKAESCVLYIYSICYATNKDLNTLLVYVMNGENTVGAITKASGVDTMIQGDCSDDADLEWWVLV